MLTATYTLVALSVEQASVRIGLLSLRQYAQANLRYQNTITLAQLQYACESLDRLYQACHWRKVEIYLIPALRQATQQADQLLDELGRLNSAALDIVKTMQRRTRDMTEQSERHVTQVCAHIESFCSVLLQRLEKEEAELFAIARSAICGEAWFSIANKFLLHDAYVVEARRRKATVIPLLRAVAAEPQPDAEAEVWPGGAPAVPLEQRYRADPGRVEPGRAAPGPVASGPSAPSRVVPGRAASGRAASGLAAPDRAALDRAAAGPVTSGPSALSRVASGRAAPGRAAL